MLLEGLDATITKTATIVPEYLDEDMHIFKPLQFQTHAVVKIAVEPLNPSELPKMVRSRHVAATEHRLDHPNGTARDKAGQSACEMCQKGNSQTHGKGAAVLRAKAYGTTPCGRGQTH